MTAVTEPSWNPRTGNVVSQADTSTADKVEATLMAAVRSAPHIAAAAPGTRAGWLRAVADTLDRPAVAAELVNLADRETALGEARLSGELARTAAQLRFYASVAEEGSYLGATLGSATPTTAAIARTRVPLGPVAVFGASNFPFAFGVLGNDTASALAAGCPVVAKAHPAHPVLSTRLGEVAKVALEAAGAPLGSFDLVAGFEAGSTLVTSPHTAAVGFTGSQRGGLALWRLANQREVVIPVFAEMGTVNPVVVTHSAARTQLADVARGAVESFTLGAGQYCTKPGLLLAPAGTDMASVITRLLSEDRSPAWHLTHEIAAAARDGIDELTAAGAEVVVRGPGPAVGWAATPTVLRAPISALTDGSRLLEECFGPVILLVDYANEAKRNSALDALQGCLVASVMTGGADDPETAALVTRLSTLAGRVTVDDWPTGVSWTWAQQHGGPWPATSAPAATSVGAAALDRFTRPVAFQSVPDHALPPALQSANPWALPRRVDSVLRPAPAKGLAS
ncbi:aldehyde dehydrogenase family protein [Leekyejoonella antrihumi]|uniref:Aldehyde dehydrogenase family protein n=1 Tax=Leekyejoonella antrihumi TaxID=1660198 RepID=A0A563DSY7_9MICO|nr:aldehyde dehydrogenase family protein [Leekyejoonella antrihumi]TWP33051.1 aldehyde dehydrogenase family protein [Leekyejoonella antrihumi]